MNVNETWELAFNKAVNRAHSDMLQSMLGCAAHLAGLFGIDDIYGFVSNTWRMYFPEDGTRSASIT